MRSSARGITTGEPINALIEAGAVVAIGISGGKDSQAVALATIRHLEAIGHHGPRILVHADLGRVEWQDSITVCEKLAAHLSMELIVVRRTAGDMLDRWESRWRSRSEAYVKLETVKLTLPWATPSMRFCTSEMKVDVIARELRKRFPTGPIISVDGVRAQESSARAKKSISSPSTKLSRKSHVGINWHPILPWSTQDVFEEIASAGLEPHVAYRFYGSSRVSCNFCIMGSLPDLTIAAKLDEHLDTYRSLVDLECRSSFGFQGSRWLGDLAPDRLTDDLRIRLVAAKSAASIRRAAEALIPESLLFVRQGWPTFVPSHDQATLLADVRRKVGAACGLDVRFTDPSSIQAHFASLMNTNISKVA